MKNIKNTEVNVKRNALILDTIYSIFGNSSESVLLLTVNSLIKIFTQIISFCPESES